MRTSIATSIVASLISILITSTAGATPTQVNVRIEGRSETLFEGPIWTQGHDVEASSDSQERECDGTNNEAHPTPGPTPTAASVDAMSIVGETFDGQWYPGYDDYFITRWGPDEQSLVEAYWGVLVNNVFTNVGGCQYELGPGNEVLWVYDAFQDEPFLALLPVEDKYVSGVRPLTALAHVGQPFEVEVLDYADNEEDDPPSSPEREGAVPLDGADVAPVETSTNGFEKIETSSPQTVRTDAQGRADITFDEPGWHRIKATVITEGREDTARSNRLDVCVPLPRESGCGESPVEDLVRTPPLEEEEIKQAEVKRQEEIEREEDIKRQGDEGETPLGNVNPVSTQNPTLSAQAGAGDLSGDGSAGTNSKVLMHEDDRWSGLRYHGHWRQLAQPGAWLGTVSRGRAGAWVSARLRAGRPVFELRGTSSWGEVEVIVGSHREVFAVARGSSAALRRLIATHRSRAGTVTLRVLKGTVDLDGVALES